MYASNPLRDLILGVDREVPLADGSTRVYANFDNAASTPPLEIAHQTGTTFMEHYASIHRGTGYKSQLASEWYEESRRTVLDFVNASSESHCAIFTTNTTDALNRLAQKLPKDDTETVLISHMEHHANDLPWRSRGPVLRLPVNNLGEISPDMLDEILFRNADRIRLVSITGCSNVLGTLQPIEECTNICHRYDIPIAIDAAQLAPHCPISMQLPDGDHIDFLVLSGHKMYAPYGGGALIAPKSWLSKQLPALRGGGAVQLVLPDDAYWVKPPESEEAGSPNVLGAVAMATAMRQLQTIGFDTMESIEKALMRNFIEGLEQIPETTIYGYTASQHDQRRTAVIAFNLGNYPHDFVASVLAHEGGIGVRNGRFCAHPFVLQILGINEDIIHSFKQRLVKGDRRNIPGAVRASFGFYNTSEEVAHALEILERISEGEFDNQYKQQERSEHWIPKRGAPDYLATVRSLMPMPQPLPEITVE